VEVLHPSPNDWIDVSEKELLMRASAWYVDLVGQPALPDGQESTAVRIPVGQRFDPAALRANMRSCP
jgi:hypothetical protein